MAVYDLMLDTDKQSIVPQQVRARQGDSDSCVIVAEVTENGVPYDFSGKTVRFECTRPDGSVVRDPEVSVSGASLTYSVPREVMNAAGTIRAAYFRILDGATFIDSTESFVIFVDKGIASGDVGERDYLGDVDRALAALKQQTAGLGEEEAQRVANESARATAEAARVAAEALRKTAEEARDGAESLRLAAELERDAAELERLTAEDERDAAEEDRAIAELAREEAEAYRRATFAEIEQRTKGWLRYWCGEGEYDPVTREPAVADPNTATMYFVPAEHPAGGDVWTEWVWDDRGDVPRWEQLGTSEATVAPITADQMDAIIAGTDGDDGGSEVMTRWGLRYWLTLLRGVFSPLLHAHKASDVTSGQFPTDRLSDGSVTADKLASGSVGIDHLDTEMREGWESLSQPPVRSCSLGKLASFLRVGNTVFLHFDSKEPLKSGSNTICDTPEGFRPIWSVYAPTDTGGTSINARLYVSRSVVSVYNYSSGVNSNVAGYISYPTNDPMPEQ